MSTPTTEVEALLTDDQRRVTVDAHAEAIQATSDRLECLRIIKSIAGTVSAFLEARQPALGDMTGRELLETQPAELLERLRELEGGISA